MQIFVIPVDIRLGEARAEVQFFELETSGSHTILQLKEKIAVAVREQVGETMDVERIMIAKNEEASQGTLLNYLMDDQTVEHYSLENGSMVNIYFWTGSNVLANG
jgi:hypothetical protein